MIKSVFQSRARWRSCLLFSILLFFCAGLRSCDNTVTFGFPTISWELTPSRIWITHLTNIIINFVFVIFALWFALQLTNTRHYRESPHLRWGGWATIAYLAYVDLVLPSQLFISPHPASNDFLEFLQGIAGYPVAIPFFLEAKFFDTFSIKNNFLHILFSARQEKFQLAYPALLTFYPHVDDMIYRLNVVPALTLVFFLGFGISKFKSWIRKKFIKVTS